MSDDMVCCPNCGGSKFFLIKKENEVVARCCGCWLKKEQEKLKL